VLLLKSHAMGLVYCLVLNHHMENEDRILQQEYIFGVVKNISEYFVPSY